MRIARWLVAALLFAVAAPDSRGNGTIDESGATITIGNGAPKGTKTVDPGAPAAVAPAVAPLGSLGTIGTFSSQLPAFPGGGTGSDGAFTGSGAVASPGGTFNHTTYTVDAAATVTYGGAVTIRTTGDVVINGTVTTTAAGASITILCGGSVTMGAAGKVQSAGATSPVLVDSNGNFASASGAQVIANGDCEIRTHGGDVTLPNTVVSAQAGNLKLRASGGVAATSTTSVTSTNGSLLIQAFGGDVALNSGGLQPVLAVTVTAGAQPLTIEAANHATFTNNVILTGAAGPVSVSAFGGDAKFLTTADISGGTGVTLRASAGVQITGNARFEPAGDIAITAFGGDVSVSSVSAGVKLYPAGDLTLRASASVLMSETEVRTGATNVLIRAHGDRVEFGDAINIDNVASLDVRAASGITTTTGFLGASSVAFSAGAAGITTGLSIVYSIGDLTFTALGPVSVGGRVHANDGNIVVTSCDAGVTLAGGQLDTHDSNDATGSITVQSFADTAGVLDLTGGTIVTGTNSQNDAKSGDIRLIVHLAKVTGGSVAYDSFLLPKRVAVKTNTKTPSKSTLTIAGVIDFGTHAAPAAGAPATLTVGSAAPFAIPSFTAVKKGRALDHTIPGLSFRITLPKPGSSRGSFTLVRTGDLANEVQKDGSLHLHFAGSGIDADGVVNLAKGRYTLGKIRGGLIVPCIFPQSVALTVKGPGQDKVSLVMGFETAGYDVTIVPCIKIGIGGAFTAEIPRASFRPKGQTLVFKGNVNGITDVKIDFAKERITVTGKGMTLTGLPAGSGPVRIALTLDTVAIGIDERIVDVQLAHGGTALTY